MRLFGLLFLFCCLSLATVQAQDEQLTDLSSTISDKLLSLKIEIRSWNDELLATTTRLDAVSESLRLSESEVLEWKERSTKLSTSLSSINEELTNSHELSIRLEQKLGTAVKIAVIFFAIIVVRFLAMLIGFILYAKNVPMPKWLMILL